MSQKISGLASLSAGDLTGSDLLTAVDVSDNTMAPTGTNKKLLVSSLDSRYATAAQGTLADSAVQPGDDVSELNNDAGYLVAADIAGKADKTINIGAGPGLMGGGTLAADRVLALATPTTTVIGGVKRNVRSAGQFVSGIATDGSLEYDTPAGSGDVTGPASSVNGNFASFSGTGGKTIQDSGVSASSFASATHASSHVTGGSDKIRDASSSQDGLMTTAYATKLDGIETAADVTDATNVGASINGATAKTTPVDADALPILDSAASNVLKKVTWANIKTTLKTYFDTLYAKIGPITSSGLTMATGALLGRSTASTGAVEEITIGTGLDLTAGVLSATGGGGGTKNWTLIATRVLAGNTVEDFTGLTAYRNYLFTMEDVCCSANGYELRIRVSTNNGSSFDSGATDYNYDYDFTGIYGPGRGTTDHGKLSYTTRDTVGDGLTGRLVLWTPNINTLKTYYDGKFTENDYNSAEVRGINVNGRRNAISLVNAVRFYFSSGTLNTGTIRCYGWTD